MTVAGDASAAADDTEPPTATSSVKRSADASDTAAEPPQKKRTRDTSDGAAPSQISVPLWLSSAGESADLNSIPWPTTSASARIEDRNSVFVGYVYPLASNSNAAVSSLLNHLTRIVHPTIPVSSLPPQFQNSAPSRRGSTHDMYAYRVMQLKVGRTGLGGPSDFGTEQGQEDDGEKWGGDKVTRVIRDLGASDVLVIVSRCVGMQDEDLTHRWYGGELLGPVRFDHITHCARSALQAHMDEEVRCRLTLC